MTGRVAPLLLEQLKIRGTTLRNRVMISPMCTYAAGPDGIATAFHLVHAGRFALGGAGLVMLEATAIEPRGRISYHDLGLWDETQVEPLARISSFVAGAGAVPGIQLGHAGRRAATQAPWDGFGPLGDQDRADGYPPWPVVGPGSAPYGNGYPPPEALTNEGIRHIVSLWGTAAARAIEAGFQVIEIHAAHGYLLHSFLSPRVNDRRDQYGSSFENRIRLLVDVVDEVRRCIPDETPLFVRLSTVDNMIDGWEMTDTIRLTDILLRQGVDLIDCSSGGASSNRDHDVRVPREFSFHAHHSREIKTNTNAKVATVGLIVDPVQAESILGAGDADLIAIGREALYDPNWAHHADVALRGDHRTWSEVHPHSGWWLHKRSGLLDRLSSEGKTPLDRYQQ